jgi:hypothetical protein
MIGRVRRGSARTAGAAPPDGTDGSPDSRTARSPGRSACALLPPAAAAAAALLLSACGSSSPTTSTVHPPVQAASRVTPIPRPLGAGADIVSSSHTGPVKARTPAGAIDDEVNASGAKTINPCTLVSRAEAQAILGKPVGQPVSAPQGPTCIYKPQGKTPVVTLAVESLHFSTTKPQAQLRDRMSVTVSGHTAYCGVAGDPTMILPLPAGRFLDVTAPCPLAAAFAAKALSHIPG